MKKTDVNKIPDQRMLDVKAQASADLAFHDPRRESVFEVTGLFGFARDHQYCRVWQSCLAGLPAAVQPLAWNPAGGRIRFVSDSQHITLKVKLSKGLRPVDSMPLTGSQGFDLYIGKPYHEAFYYSTMISDAEYEFEAYKDLKVHEPQSFLIHLPLFAGIDALSIGLDKGASLTSPEPYIDPGAPIVVYGDGIVQGRCASRPGMAWPNQLSRALRREVLNFGFDGAARGELSMAQYLAAIPQVSAYILSYEGDCPKEYIRTLAPFVEVLRDAHPLTPIAILSATRGSLAMAPTLNKQLFDNRGYARSFVADRHLRTDLKLYFIDGWTILAPEHQECLADEIHLNDTGFRRLANALLPRITQYLKTHYRTGLVPA